MTFAEDSRVTRRDGRYSVELKPAWESLPGVVHGGFLSAVALRSIGAEAPGFRPLCAQISFLNPAKVGPLELNVTLLRGSKRTSTLKVEAVQGDTVTLSAIVPCGLPSLEGFEYPRTRKPPFPTPEECPVVHAESAPAVVQHVEFRTDMDHTRPTPGRAYYRGWTRLLEGGEDRDPFLEAGRLLFLADVIVATPLYIQEQKSALELPFITPSLDMFIQFQESHTSEWVMLESEITAAHGGTVCAQLTLWSEPGERVANAVSTLLCRPNPFATRVHG